MVKPAFIIWILAFTVFAGALVTAVLLIPSLQAMLGTAIVAATALAAVIAVPFSRSVARAIQ
jgi:hypothetical protein